jgi:hypothetical protein
MLSANSLPNIPIADPDQRLAAKVAAPGVRKPAPNLGGLSRGELQEQFEHVWFAVMQNIADPNTVDDAVRKITITIELKPYEGNRQEVTMKTRVVPTFAPNSPILSTVYVEGVNSKNPNGFEVGRHEAQ